VGGGEPKEGSGEEEGEEKEDNGMSRDVGTCVPPDEDDEKQGESAQTAKQELHHEWPHWPWGHHTHKELHQEASSSLIALRPPPVAHHQLKKLVEPKLSFVTACNQRPKLPLVEVFDLLVVNESRLPIYFHLNKHVHLAAQKGGPRDGA